MPTADLPGADSRQLTWQQQLSLAVGVVYLLLGAIGFSITGVNDEIFGNGTDLSNGGTHAHSRLFGLMINPAHNAVHLLIGVAGVALSRSPSGARTYGWLLAVAYGAAFVYGLVAIGEAWDILNVNVKDNVLHVVTATVGLIIARGPVRTATTEHGQGAAPR